MKRVIILLVVLYAGIATAAIDPNLVAWWTLDEGTGAIAYDSAGDNDGQLINETIWTAGQIGGGLSFDGINDYVDVPDDASLRFNQFDSFSICSWVKPTSMDRDGRVVCKMRSDGRRGIFGYETGWDSINRRFDFLAESSFNYYIKISTPNESVSAGIWHHVVCVYENKNMKIYLNGELKSSGSFAGNTGTTSPDKNLSIGARSYDSTFERYLNGTLDDVRIYNRALSAEEVEELYEEGFPELTGLEIIGPDEVAEKFTESYRAIAYYDNGTSKDVTASAEWSVEPDTISTIDTGQLTTGQALYPEQDVTLYAQYTENETTVNAEKQVSILAICPTGTALKFDGVNDFVKIPDSSTNQITTNQMSISAWIKLSRDVGPTQRRVICKQQTNTRAWGLEIGGQGYAGLTGNQIVFHDSSGTNAHNCISQTHLVPNRWYHIGISDDGGKIRLYLNGQLDASSDSGYGIPTSINAPVMIGRTNPDSTFYFDGIIDEVALFDQALSADEIKAMMHNKTAGSIPNLIAYWDFDDANGQIAADASGRHNDGILGGSTSLDTVDPCWVESDAPIGQCTTEEVVVRDIVGATEDKANARQSIADAIAKEQASLELIEQLRRQAKGAQQRDLLNAKANIHVAITQEQAASLQIDATISRLEEALRQLGYEMDSNIVEP